MHCIFYAALFIGCCVLLPFGNNFFYELLMYPTGNCFAFLDIICIVNCIFLCPFALFKILRFLLSTIIFRLITKILLENNNIYICTIYLTYITITDFTIIFWPITNILLENNNIYIFTIYLTYTIYTSPFQYNDITLRVVMFP